MAWVVSSLIAQSEGTIASSIEFQEWFTNQVLGDFIVVVATNDGGGTALSITGSWTELFSPAPNNSNCRTAIWVQEHTGTAIASPIISGANEEWAVGALLVRDADTLSSWVSDVTNQTTNTFTPTSPSVTTVTNNCLILRILGKDGTGTSLQSNLFGQGVTNLYVVDRFDNTVVNVGTFVDSHSQAVAGVTGTYTWRSSQTDGGRQATIAIPNKSGGRLGASISATPVVVETFVTGTAILLFDLGHTTLLGSTVRSAIDGGSLISSLLSQNAPAALSGYRGWIRSLGQNQTTTTGLPGIYGAAFLLTAPVDLSSGLTYLPIDGPAASSAYASGGLGIYFRDSIGNWAIWRPLTKAAGVDPRMCIANLPSAVMADASATAIDWSSIAYIGICLEILTITTVNQARSASFSPILHFPSGTEPILTGGSSAQPLTPREISSALQSGALNLYPKTQGVKQQLWANSLIFGNGGISEFHLNGNAQSVEIASGDPGFLASENSINIKINLGSSDSLSFNALALGSGRIQSLEVDSLSSGSFTPNGTIFGMSVTTNGKSFAGCAFSECDKIIADDSNLDSCSVSASVSTNASVRVSDGASLASAAFTKGAETYAIEVQGTGTITLIGATFLGYTTPIDILATSGTVTIILGQDDDPADFTYDTAGATVVYDQPVLSTAWANLDLSNDTTILVYNVTTSTTIDYINSLTGGVGYLITLLPGVDYTVGDIIEIRQSRKSGTTYAQERTSKIITASSGGSILEEGDLLTDTITTGFALDGASFEPDYSLDYTNDELDIDVSGNWSLASLMAYWKYKITEQSVMEQFWGAWEVREDGSFMNQVSVLSSYLDLTSINDAIETTGRRIWRSDSTRPVRSPTTSGYAIDVAWREPVTVVETGTSGLTTAEANTLEKINTLTEDSGGIRFTAKSLETITQSTIDANVTQVNYLPVTGSGTELDPWRPV